MATILEEAVWTLTEAAAERMVANGLLVKCERNHTDEIVVTDLPIYHIACDAPNWFGFSTMDQAIRSAESHVEKESILNPDVDTTSDHTQQIVMKNGS